MSAATLLFPPRPRGLKGRATELTVLARTIEQTKPARLALVGAGGSGKSMLAAALAYRLPMPRDWFRIGAWDYRTLLEMLALRWGTTRDRRAIEGALRRFLAREERLVVLDNHEDDAATARLLDTLAGTKATFLVTARRCLLAGVLIFPVTAPLVTAGKTAFPRVAALTRTLRWNPLALDIADAIVGSRAVSVAALARFLDAQGIGRVRVIDHEDDLPEVSLLVDWAWERLPAASRRVLAVLAHAFGDHVDARSLATLADCDEDAIAPLERWHLVQESMPRRFALHAVVRYALQKRTTADAARTFVYYMDLLENEPERIDAEQTHLFAAMDHAHRTSDMHGMLRVERLLSRLEAGPSRGR
ncbi:MAG: ATP-binding protein [Labilithrix sp.]|nr:ATP-binding protein [Labilithrix sp.]MCW5810737.1 ATP-binding protein [Labilithrix sp.]